MNIYLTGSHGTGKTTAAKIIAEKTGLSLVPSASRMSPYEQGTIDHQDFVMDMVYKRCATWDNVVHERTPFDVYSYTRNYSNGSSHDLHRHGMKVNAFTRNMSKDKNTLFYFPISFPLIDDGVRPDDFVRQEVDLTIRQMFELTNVNFTVVPCGSPEERADFIIERSLINAVV